MCQLRGRKAKGLNYTQDSSFFQRAALSGIQTHHILLSRRVLYQLSYQQGNSECVCSYKMIDVSHSLSYSTSHKICLLASAVQLPPRETNFS